MTQNTPENQEFSKDDLFIFTMEKQWDKVVEIYEKHSESHTTKLTKSEETALHISVSSYHHKCFHHSKHIKKMIDCIEKSSSVYNVLSMQNIKGDTPLHLAAAVGWEAICEYIASKDRKLIGLRNASGETPLFIAAHHGKLQAFLCLHEIHNEDGEADESLCRKNDGTTTLHVAISGEYFRLAYQIMSYYPRLIFSVNVNGESPLHVLARKPNVFKSSNQLGFFNSIFYRCVLVELKKEKYNPRVAENGYSPSSEINLPKNYRTSSFGRSKEHNRGPIDEEDQHHRENTTQNEESNDDDIFPPNYTTLLILLNVILRVLVGGYFIRMKNIKEQHCHTFQIMRKMIELERRNFGNKEQRPVYDQMPESIIEIPDSPPIADEDDALDTTGTIPPSPVLIYDTPLLVAAKTGIPEMVKKILDTFPEAILEQDSNGKNVLLLAVENRQVAILNYLLSTNLPDYIFYQLDNQGNNILHLAAMLGEDMHPWRTPCVPLQLSWEIKWYKHVEASTPPLVQDNTERKSPRKIFTETHAKLVKEGKEWLTKTSESCSVVSTLIASVTFATIGSVPGGSNDQTGHPILGNYTAFHVFSVASLLALCLSVTALIFFLSIITSRCEEGEFKTTLPMKLFIGLTSMSASIAAMLVAFCAGHTFIWTERLGAATVPIYSFATLPVMFFAIAQLPLYFDFVCAAYIERPLLGYRVIYN